VPSVSSLTRGFDLWLAPFVWIAAFCMADALDQRRFPVIAVSGSVERFGLCRFVDQKWAPLPRSLRGQRDNYPQSDTGVTFRINWHNFVGMHLTYLAFRRRSFTQ
jgi:hypothetical protein